MFIEKLLGLINEKGITKNKLLTDLSLSKNSFVDWGKRGTVPSGDVLIKLANYFNVSVDYLTGNSDKIELDILDFPLMTKYRHLDDQGKRVADEMLDYLLAQKNLHIISNSVIEGMKKKPVPKNEDELDRELLQLLSCFTPAETQRIVDFAKGIAATHKESASPDK